MRQISYSLWVRVMVFNVTGLMSWLCNCGVSFCWWRKHEYQDKTTDLPQITDKLHHILTTDLPQITDKLHHILTTDLPQITDKLHHILLY